MSEKSFQTREISIGKVKVGKDNPIRIQSMTNTDTRDFDKTIEQIIRLADAGCEIARVTVQGKKEAEACEKIKNGLLQKGYDIPLVADIHFYPPAAMMVADFVDKVRINPGNYIDRRATFRKLEYTDEDYQKEIQKIDEGFSPLVLKCKRLNKAMRIGTNHGSLSDRIMNRFGDTPMGMVESAFEFARVCRKYDFHNFCFSMKSSNPLVMREVYRLLVHEMEKIGWDYPLHLGVTEAGCNQEGRVKSSIGIGSLLLEGIGDTIRVSLTEDPVCEIDPCQRLIELASQKLAKIVEFKPFEKRKVDLPSFLHRDGTVVLKVKESDLLNPDFFQKIGVEDSSFKEQKKPDACADLLWIEEQVSSEEAIDKIQKLKALGIKILSRDKALADINVSYLQGQSLQDPAECLVISEEADLTKLDLSNHTKLILLSVKNLSSARSFFKKLKKNIPVILCFDYDCSLEDLIIYSSSEIGSLFCEGLGEGVCISGEYDLNFLRLLSFDILQGCRMRTIKTEFISCPSCGRTLFDLEQVSQRIREKTHHLPGVKIAIMGCIVNGPGEMADADFGYVGSKAGKIDLYVGKTRVEKNIDEDEADERLIELIKSHGRWIEPKKELAVT